jgi:hypothetical protein
MPNGDLVIRGGHHRVEAMRRLGETTIPTRIVKAGSGGPVGEAYILDIGKLTGRYQSSYYPELTVDQRGEANRLLELWKADNGY